MPLQTCCVTLKLMSLSMRSPLQHPLAPYIRTLSNTRINVAFPLPDPAHACQHNHYRHTCSQHNFCQHTLYQHTSCQHITTTTNKSKIRTCPLPQLLPAQRPTHALPPHSLKRAPPHSPQTFLRKRWWLLVQTLLFPQPLNAPSILTQIPKTCVPSQTRASMWHPPSCSNSLTTPSHCLSNASLTLREPQRRGVTLLVSPSN